MDVVFWFQTCRITILFNITCHAHDQYHQCLYRSPCNIYFQFARQTARLLTFCISITRGIGCIIHTTYERYAIMMHLSTLFRSICLIKCFSIATHYVQLMRCKYWRLSFFLFWFRSAYCDKVDELRIKFLHNVEHFV